MNVHRNGWIFQIRTGVKESKSRRDNEGKKIRKNDTKMRERKWTEAVVSYSCVETFLLVSHHYLSIGLLKKKINELETIIYRSGLIRLIFLLCWIFYIDFDIKCAGVFVPSRTAYLYFYILSNFGCADEDNPQSFQQPENYCIGGLELESTNCSQWKMAFWNWVYFS